MDENGLFPTFDEDSVFKLVLQTAQHRLVAPSSRPGQSDREVLALSKWICDNTRLMEKGEKPIPMRKLKQILTSYGCTWAPAPRVGNRLNITRQLEKRGVLGFKKKELLQTQIFFSADGSDVQKNTIKKVRFDLRLDDEHGIDSRLFYRDAGVSPGEFISRYRKTLRRLAKL
jgi:hypothetical protein